MDLVITDPRYEAKPRGPLDRALLTLIRDERDLPFLHLILQMTFIQLPLAVALFVPGWFSGWLAAAYLVVTFAGFVDRYILMLHNTSHRRLYKKPFEWLNAWHVWVLGPLNGETPETYFAHHIGMHHAEGNLPGDLSSTMRFQRDRIDHFLRYFFRFFGFGMFELSAYMLRNRRPKLLRRLLLGELSWYAVVIALAVVVSWKATLVVLVVPMAVVRFLMMAGNWAQHSFIDQADPANDYKSSITCINSRYNRRCFNDGYHIGHHETPTRHWTEMPEDFENNRQRYIDNDAVIFEGIDYFMIWLFLMLRRYDWLVKRFVELRDEPRSAEEIEALLRSRTRAFDLTEYAAGEAQPAN